MSDYQESTSVHSAGGRQLAVTNSIGIGRAVALESDMRAQSAIFGLANCLAKLTRGLT